MIQVETNHLGCPACGATGFDGACCPVPDFKKAHETAGSTASAEFLSLSPYIGKIRSHTRSVFEYARFPDPEVHNAAIIYQVIFHTQDETGVWLRTFVGRRRLLQKAVCLVNVIMSLGLTGDAITFK